MIPHSAVIKLWAGQLRKCLTSGNGKIIFSIQMYRPALGLTKPIYLAPSTIFMAVKALRSEAAHLHLVPSLRMNAAAPPLSYAFIPYTGAFHHYFSRPFILIFQASYSLHFCDKPQVSILRSYTSCFRAVY